MKTRKEQQATRKQTWAVFCMTGWDVRGCDLTIEQAGQLIDHLKDGKAFVPDNYNGARQVREIKANREKSHRDLFNKAVQAGKQALATCVPEPMIVAEHENQLNDNSPIKQSWFVEGGACGFGWVIIRPGTCSFARWLKKNGHGSKSYYGGMQYWVHDGGQSYERKQAFASAFARVLQEAGIKASAGGRLD